MITIKVIQVQQNIQSIILLLQYLIDTQLDRGLVFDNKIATWQEHIVDILEKRKINKKAKKTDLEKKSRKTKKQKCWEK